MTKHLSIKRHLTNFFIVILVIGAVNPFFAVQLKGYQIFLLLLLFFLALVRKVILIDKKILLILFFVHFLIVLQAFKYGGFSLAFIYKPIFIFYIPYLVYRILGVSFFKYYVKVLFAIAIYTTPLWLLQTLFPTVDSLFRSALEIKLPFNWDQQNSLLFYTPAWSDNLFNPKYGIYRNSGIFHEPGAYSIFLLMGLIVNTQLHRKLFDLKNLLFIFCILTTLSTAGYIALFIVLTAHIIRLRINAFFKVIILFVFAYMSYEAYVNEEFLQPKIQEQYENQIYAVQENLGSTKAQSGRFFGFFTSFDLFLKNPVIGRGIIFSTSEKATGEMNVESSYIYGIMGFFATYGFIFGLLYLYYFYIGFRCMSNISGLKGIFTISSFISINLVLQTQIFFTSIIFVFIFIIGIYFPRIQRKALLLNTKIINETKNAKY